MIFIHGFSNLVFYVHLLYFLRIGGTSKVFLLAVKFSPLDEKRREEDSKIPLVMQLDNLIYKFDQ